MEEIIAQKACPIAVSGATGAAPVAGTTICTITPAVAGVYRVYAITRVTGTPDPLQRNAQLLKAAAVVRDCQTQDQPGLVQVVNDLALDGSTAVALKVTANAGAGAIYNGCIIAVRITV